MTIFYRLIAYLFLSVLIKSCDINYVKETRVKKIVIASDFLKPKDTMLFYAFTKEKGIRLKIIHLTTDEIKKKLNKSDYNSKFDLVFVKSLYSVKELKSISFHRISKSTIKESMSNFRVFKNNTWFAVGLDPYGISYIVDSIEKPKRYSELSNEFKFSSLRSTNMSVFLAHESYLLKKNPNYFLILKKSLLKNLSSLELSTDSLPSKKIVLINWSNQFDHPKFLKDNKRIFDFELNQLNGLFADRKCIGIVKEAENFKYVILFITYLNEQKMSSNFYKKIGMLPIINHIKVQNIVKIMKLNEDSLLNRF